MTRTTPIQSGVSVCLRTAATIVAVGILATAGAQQFDTETALYAGSVRLERPESVTQSGAGEQLIICDPQVNRIAIVDYTGRPLWAVGDQVDLGHPLAGAFLSESDVIFCRATDLLVLRVSRENAAVLDTVVDLAAIIDGRRRLSQLVPDGTSGWIGLDEKTGEVLQFDADWKLTKIIAPHGSGKGNVLVPTAVVRLIDGRLIVTDRKNYPAQVFAPDGRFLFYLGWSGFGEQRGWEAVAAATDNRGLIWIADETNAVFRLFDAAGGAVGEVAFPHRLFRPVAMCGTIDQRMMVTDDAGRAVFYSIE